MKRVVVSGIGALSPLGPDFSAGCANLIHGESGIGFLDSGEFRGLSCRIGGKIPGYNPHAYLTSKEINRWDPFIHYAVSAVHMALEDAGLDPSALKRALAPGIILGSSRGGIISLEQNVSRDISGRKHSAYLMPASTVYMATGAAAMKFKLHGPSLGISTACSSGSHAIGEAFRWLQRGETDMVIAGGTEAPLCRLAVGGYAASGALSRRNSEPARASRPFDRDRDGFVISEGAAVLVLENLDSALKRSAGIYGEIAGFGNTTDAAHETRPRRSGAVEAMLAALRDAGIPPEEIGFINAHGTSTRLGDRIEAEAIIDVFGAAALKIPVTANKSMTGHLLGASGALEAAFTIMSLKEGVIPPTINLADPEFDLLFAREKAMPVEASAAISNSFGFGGANAVLAFRKYEQK